MSKLRGVALVLLLMGIACGKQAAKEEATEKPGAAITLGTVASSVKGNVVSLPVSATGVTIVKADGDTSGKTGHFHVFVDKDPVAVGQTIAKERGIVHSADSPVKVWGLKPGSHTFTVVLGDGAHERLDVPATKTVTVNVEGPSVQGTAPASIDSGEALEIALASQGVEVVKADGDASGKTGHLHVLVDPATPPKGGDTIAAAVPGKIYHTTEASVSIPGLAKGEHTVWIVLGDGNHKAFDPPAMDKLTVTVA
jgi:hypothetical protein